MTGTPTYVVATRGDWSGGGSAVLDNFAHAVARHQRLSFDGLGVMVISRNFPNLRPRGGYVLIPQNAWPWAGPKRGAQERAKLTGMRIASEVAMRAAIGVIRLGPSIPDIGRSHESFLPNPLDPGFEDAVAGIDRAAPPASSPYFATIGSLNSYRGVETVLDAYLQYRQQGGRTSLAIAGGGREHYVARIRQRAERLPGVELRCRRLPRRECVATLHGARMAVLPSHVEASPISLLEALAVQRNVAASAVPGHAAIVPPETAPPRYFKHSDPSTLTRLMHEADKNVGAGTDHPLSSGDFREAERGRWGATLMRMLDRLMEGALT